MIFYNNKFNIITSNYYYFYLLYDLILNYLVSLYHYFFSDPLSVNFRIISLEIEVFNLYGFELYINENCFNATLANYLFRMS